MESKVAHRVLLLLGFLSILTFSFGQKYSKEVKEFVKGGDALYNYWHDYEHALDYYLEAYDLSESESLIIKIAHTYRKLRLYNKAIVWYKKIRDLKLETEYPKAQFWEARMLMAQGSHIEAKQMLDDFMSSYRGVDNTLMRADLTHTSCQFAISSIQNPVRVKIENAGIVFNTKMTEKNVVMLNDKSIYYSADTKTDFEGKSYLPKLKNSELDELDEVHVNTVYEGVLNRNEWYTKPSKYFPVLIGHEIVGTPAIFKSGTVLYIALRKIGSADVFLYRSEKKGGSWSKLVKMSGHINQKGAIAKDPFAFRFGDDEVLFYSSNKKDGSGGFDIYYAVLDWRGKLIRSENLGETYNTEFDEVTPFYYNVDHALYFSSNGYEGIGQLDIFVLKGNISDGWDEVVNMGYPLNTSYDDYYFTYDSREDIGYFTSNRPGGLNLYSQYDDIYRFKFKFKEEVIDFGTTIRLYDSESEEIIDDAVLKVYDKTKMNEPIYKYRIDKGDESVTFPLRNNLDYVVKVSKVGYETMNLDVSVRKMTVASTTQKVTYFFSNDVDHDMINALQANIFMDRSSHYDPPKSSVIKEEEVEDKLKDKKEMEAESMPSESTLTSNVANDSKLKPVETIKNTPGNNSSQIESNERVDNTLNQLLLELIKENKELRKTIAQMQTKINDNYGELLKLIRDMKTGSEASMNSKVQELQNKILSENKRMSNSLTTLVDQFNTENDAIKKSLIDIKVNNAIGNESKLEAIASLKKQMEVQRSKMNSSIIGLDNDIDESSIKVKTSFDDLKSSSRPTSAIIEASEDEMISENDNLKQQIIALQKQLIAESKEISSVLSSIKVEQNQNKGTYLEELNDEKLEYSLKEALRQLEKENYAIKDHLNEVQSHIQTAKNLLRSLKNRMGNYDSSIDGTQRDLNTYNDQLNKEVKDFENNYDTKLNAVKSNILAIAGNSNKDTQTKQKAIEDVKDQVLEENNVLKAEISNLESKMEKGQREFESLVVQLHKEGLSTDKQRAINQLKNQLKKENDLLRLEIDQMYEQLENSSRRINSVITKDKFKSIPSNYVPQGKGAIIPSDYSALDDEAAYKEILKKYTFEKRDNLLFRVQVGAYTRSHKNFYQDLKKIGSVGEEVHDNLYKYIIGGHNNLSDAIDLVQKVRAEGYSDAFICTYYSGKRISLVEAYMVFDK